MCAAGHEWGRTGWDTRCLVDSISTGHGIIIPGIGMNNGYNSRFLKDGLPSYHKQIAKGGHIGLEGRVSLTHELKGVGRHFRSLSQGAQEGT